MSEWIDLCELMPESGFIGHVKTVDGEVKIASLDDTDFLEAPDNNLLDVISWHRPPSA